MTWLIADACVVALATLCCVSQSLLDPATSSQWPHIDAQETPDPPEALRCMPSLQLADIPTRASTVPTAVAEEAGVSVLRHELFTNDVLYLEAALDLRPVPPSLLHLVPLFCRCASMRPRRHTICRRCHWQEYLSGFDVEW